MKIEQSNRGTITGGDTPVRSNVYTIAASPKMMKMLSEGVYKDKIMAVVGEYCANAADEHRMSNGGKPFEVQLPNVLSPEFIVKDFGRGLSDDDVMGLFTQYGWSTKDQSDTTDNGEVIIGGFGVGSKAWAAYTDTFVVESRFNGSITTFAGHLNNEDMPTITLVNKLKTDEPNGLSIKIPVKKDDMTTFKERLKTVLEFYTVQPIVSGVVDFKPNKAEYVLLDIPKGYGIKERKGLPLGSRRPRLIVGERSFPLDFDIINVNYPDRQGLDLVDLWVPMGTVEVAVSREEISYTPETIRNLKEHFLKVKECILNTYTKKIKLISNLHERSKALGEASKSSSIISSNHSQLSDKLNCNTSIEIKGGGIKVVEDGYGSQSGLRLISPSYSWSFFYRNGKDIYFIILDEKKSCSIRTKAYAELVYERYKTEGKTKPSIIQVEEDRWLKVWSDAGEPYKKFIKRISDTPYIKPTRGVGVSGTVTTYMADGLGSIFKDYATPVEDSTQEYLVITHESVEIFGKDYSRSTILKLLGKSSLKFIFKSSIKVVEDLDWGEGSMTLLNLLPPKLAEEKGRYEEGQLKAVMQGTNSLCALSKMIGHPLFKVTPKNKTLVNFLKKSLTMKESLERKYSSNGVSYTGKVTLRSSRSSYSDDGPTSDDMAVVKDLLKEHKIKIPKCTTIEDDYAKAKKVGLTNPIKGWEEVYPMLKFTGVYKYSTKDVVEYVSSM